MGLLCAALAEQRGMDGKDGERMSAAKVASEKVQRITSWAAKPCHYCQGSIDAQQEASRILLIEMRDTGGSQRTMSWCHRKCIPSGQAKR